MPPPWQVIIPMPSGRWALTYSNGKKSNSSTLGQGYRSKSSQLMIAPTCWSAQARFFGEPGAVSAISRWPSGKSRLFS